MSDLVKEIRRLVVLAESGDTRPLVDLVMGLPWGLQSHGRVRVRDYSTSVASGNYRRELLIDGRPIVCLGKRYSGNDPRAQAWVANSIWHPRTPTMDRWPDVAELEARVAAEIARDRGCLWRGDLCAWRDEQRYADWLAFRAWEREQARAFARDYAARRDTAIARVSAGETVIFREGQEGGTLDGVSARGVFAATGITPPYWDLDHPIEGAPVWVPGTWPGASMFVHHDGIEWRHGYPVAAPRLPASRAMRRALPEVEQLLGEGI